MPIPTSLIVVLLVVAWLAVLVPMVARRREHVPQAEEDGVRFRVLRRASASIKRRRPGRGSAQVADSAADLENEMTNQDAGDLEEELLDDADVDPDDLEFEEDAAPVMAGSTPLSAPGSTPLPASGSSPLSASGSTPLSASPPRQPIPSVHRAARSAARSWTQSPEFDDDIDEFESEPAPSRVRSDDDRYGAEETAHSDSDDRYRPVPQRRGRGGYDPEAAEATRTYKYQRRRRVTLSLLLAAVAFGLLGYFFRPVLWSGTAVFGVLLIAYLAYLRRQVRIEEDIRQRRLAKLRRARQIRPEYHAGFAPAPASPAAVPPAVHPHGRRVVDLDDDDPAFDDLEYYQPIAYRRASGQ